MSISKGKMRYLRVAYRAITNRAKFVAVMRENYTSAYAKDPVKTEALIQKTADSFNWLTVSSVLPNGDTASKSNKSHWTKPLTGKHRSTVPDGEKAPYELHWGTWKCNPISNVNVTEGNKDLLSEIMGEPLQAGERLVIKPSPLTDEQQAAFNNVDTDWGSNRA